MQRHTGPSGRSFTWTLSGNVIYSVCQWAFLIVLAKLGTAEDVGGYALGLAITSPILTFANFQGRNLVASDIRDRYSFGEYLSFRIFSLTVALAAVVTIALWTRSSWTAAAVTCLLGVSQAFDWTSETYFGLMQKHDRLDRVAQSLILKGPLCLALLSAAMYATRDLVWAALSLVAGRGLVLWLFDSKISRRMAGPARLMWKRTVLAGLLRNAFPLGVISALAAFNFNIPRYFIESDLSTRELGIFSAIASLVGAGNLVMSALANNSFVAIARASAISDRAQYRKLSLRLFGTAAVLGGAGVVVAMVAGDRILGMLFRPEYGGSAGVFTRLMMAGAMGYIFSGQGYALTAAGVLLPQIPVLLCSTATTALFSWWLVPLHGLDGAAEAWLLTSLVQLVLSSIVLARVRHNGGAPPAGMPVPEAASVTAG
jgi:O-antigen/teichoic acid export membrane protein